MKTFQALMSVDVADRELVNFNSAGGETYRFRSSALDTAVAALIRARSH